MGGTTGSVVTLSGDGHFIFSSSFFHSVCMSIDTSYHVYTSIYQKKILIHIYNTAATFIWWLSFFSSYIDNEDDDDDDNDNSNIKTCIFDVSFLSLSYCSIEKLLIFVSLCVIKLSKIEDFFQSFLINFSVKGVL